MKWVLEDKSGNFNSKKIFFCKDARGISKVCHKVILTMTILQTKPRVGNTKVNYYDLYCTVIENRDEKENVNNENENNENDFINYEDFLHLIMMCQLNLVREI